MPFAALRDRSLLRCLRNQDQDGLSFEKDLPGGQVGVCHASRTLASLSQSVISLKNGKRPARFLHRNFTWGLSRRRGANRSPRRVC